MVMDRNTLIRFGFVERQSEFAFFGALTPVSAPFICFGAICPQQKE